MLRTTTITSTLGDRAELRKGVVVSWAVRVRIRIYVHVALLRGRLREFVSGGVPALGQAYLIDEMGYFPEGESSLPVG